jgi:hypothetical protein
MDPNMLPDNVSLAAWLDNAPTLPVERVRSILAAINSESMAVAYFERLGIRFCWYQDDERRGAHQTGPTFSIVPGTCAARSWDAEHQQLLDEWHARCSVYVARRVYARYGAQVPPGLHSVRQLAAA